MEIANKDISMEEFCYKKEDKNGAVAWAGCGGLDRKYCSMFKCSMAWGEREELGDA